MRKYILFNGNNNNPEDRLGQQGLPLFFSVVFIK